MHTNLSFDSQDNAFTELKAALEGGLSACQPNTLIYATSNRRHLIKENFSDREDDVNKNDTRQEQLSLSDRFGLTITFINPNKKDYLDIVEKIAADRGLQVDAQRLDPGAPASLSIMWRALCAGAKNGKNSFANY